MPAIAFFVSTAPPHANDNHERLPAAFRRAGWDVAVFDHQSIAHERGSAVAQTLEGDVVPLRDMDRYFLLGFGQAASFLDRMQILRGLDQNRFVNTPAAFILQHGKISLATSLSDAQPESYLASDVAYLMRHVEAGGEWILKPPAGSFGRDVYRVDAQDANLRVILEHLTEQGRYALLQRYLPEAETSEKRVLVAGGEIIGAYGKRARDHRGNLSAGAVPTTASLSRKEEGLSGGLGARLKKRGVRFTALDVVYPYIIEANIANPGWLQTFESLTGEDRSDAVVAALVHQWDIEAMTQRPLG